MSTIYASYPFESGSGGGGGSGTVTSVSVVTADGFSGTVANPTTTPAITLHTTLSDGSVIFAESSALAQNNANLFWDNSGLQLGVGTNSPAAKLNIDSSANNTQSPLIIKTAGVVADYTFQNSGILVEDASGAEMLRIWATDPNSAHHNAGNLYVGLQAGFSQPTDNTTAGQSNLGFGTQALYSIATGGSNTGIGFQALYNTNTGNTNTAIGSQSLFNNTSGSSNVSIGQESLFSNISGSQNIAIGNSSLLNVNTGANNIGIGFQALRGNQTESQNIAIGGQALSGLTSGTNNVSMGFSSNLLFHTGSQNVFLGYSILPFANNSSNNVGIGALSGGFGVASCNNITFVGYQATSVANGISNSTALGNGSTITASNQMVFGNGSITENLFSGDISATTFTAGGNVGLTVTITTAALTGGGAQGSMTFTGGILTAQTQAT